ncbi:Imm1 family immunity protein [Nonomuraea sp. NPDC002799]
MNAGAEARYQLEHGNAPALLTTPEEADALIDKLLTGPPLQNLAQIHSLERQRMPSGYPDHELLVGADGDRQVGILAFLDADGNVVTAGSPEFHDQPIYYIQGHPTEFPVHSEISIDLVRQAFKEFLLSGGQRPTCVQWQLVQP